ncbi:MAG: class I SAM-dependent methyltransferase [Hyphomonadaceae bacterium]|nr:class I SAM-dependent methyltransferase [Hyphomonadaceae bacterium]
MSESNQGYEDEAPELLQRYERMSFVDAHGGPGFLDLIPPPRIRVLDIGAGTGRDAAWFAQRGDDVTAIEPTRAMREGAMKLHPEPNITWIDDRLPDLASVRGRVFDLVWMSAVWMHFEEAERAHMMPTIAALLASPGTLMISLRHGPIPEGRRMFDVSAEETERLARSEGLACVRAETIESAYAAGVLWDRLWFLRA